MQQRTRVITGFDIPSPPAGDRAPHSVLVAMLDEPPDPAWLQCLSARAQAFKRARTINDVRVVGSTLCCVGADMDHRAIMAALYALVDAVNADARAGRDRGDDRAGLGPLRAETPAEQWMDSELAGLVPEAPDILRAINQLTGMRFAAMSHVDRQKWTALAFYDAMAFGMAPYQQLDLEVTICGDAMASRQTVAFGRASSDPVYACSALPSMYGFESYISVPILGEDGEVCGTVCALDAEPRELTAQMLDTMQDYARQLAGRMPRRQRGAADGG